MKTTILTVSILFVMLLTISCANVPKDRYNTQKGAAIGAVVGGVRGRRSKVVGDEMEQQANDQAASAATQAAANDYNKAFTVCMEGKGYTVK